MNVDVEARSARLLMEFAFILDNILLFCAPESHGESVVIDTEVLHSSFSLLLLHDLSLSFLYPPFSSFPRPNLLL